MSALNTDFSDIGRFSTTAAECMKHTRYHGAKESFLTAPVRAQVFYWGI